MEGKERQKKNTDHYRLLGGRFNEEGSFLRRLVLGSRKMNSFLHTASRILKVYIEAVTGFSHIYRKP